MKAALLISAIWLFPAVASAQSDDNGPLLACHALESLVVWGLIDGGEGGDTSELSATVDAGVGGVCMEWLASYGPTEGLWTPDCAALMGVIAADAFPESAWPDIPGFVQLAISGANSAACSAGLADLLGGQS